MSEYNISKFDDLEDSFKGMYRVFTKINISGNAKDIEFFFSEVARMSDLMSDLSYLNKKYTVFDLLDDLLCSYYCFKDIKELTQCSEIRGRISRTTDRFNYKYFDIMEEEYVPTDSLGEAKHLIENITTQLDCDYYWLKEAAHITGCEETKELLLKRAALLKERFPNVDKEGDNDE